MGVCAIDETTGLCTGCLRTLAEIAGWIHYSPAQRQRTMDSLAQRRGFGIPVVGRRRSVPERLDGAAPGARQGAVE